MTSERSPSRISRGIVLVIGLVFAIALVSAGMSVAFLAPQDAGDDDAFSARMKGMPDMSADSREAYRLAMNHGDLFAHMPCYCGCALLDEPHDSLYRCFVAPDGSLDRHAAGCLICTDIALEAVKLSDEGLSHAEVRARIDAKFGDAGPGTDTPLP